MENVFYLGSAAEQFHQELMPLLVGLKALKELASKRGVASLR